MRVGERAQHLEKRSLGCIEMPHIVPERVVGIEADEADCHGQFYTPVSAERCLSTGSARRTPSSQIVYPTRLSFDPTSRTDRTDTSAAVQRIPDRRPLDLLAFAGGSQA
jgi:predicted polyphosphate/ATP-dependent NAD kinase